MDGSDEADELGLGAGIGKLHAELANRAGGEGGCIVDLGPGFTADDLFVGFLMGTQMGNRMVCPRRAQPSAGYYLTSTLVEGSAHCPPQRFLEADLIKFPTHYQSQFPLQRALTSPSKSTRRIAPASHRTRPATTASTSSALLFCPVTLRRRPFADPKVVALVLALAATASLEDRPCSKSQGRDQSKGKRPSRRT